MTRQLNINQFWDRNPLITPWLEKHLPGNRMFTDFAVSLVGFVLAGAAIILFDIFILDSEFLVVAFLALICAYFPGGWWGRWAKASIDFQVAKQKERENNGRERSK